MDVVSKISKVVSGKLHPEALKPELEDYFKQFNPTDYFESKHHCELIVDAINKLSPVYLNEDDEKRKWSLGKLMILLLNKWNYLFRQVEYKAYDETLLEHLYNTHCKYIPNNERVSYWSRFAKVFKFISYTIDDIKNILVEEYNKVNEHYWNRFHRYFSFHVDVSMKRYNTLIPTYVLARMCQYLWVLEDYCHSNQGVIDSVKRTYSISNPNLGSFTCEVDWITMSYPSRKQVTVETDKPVFLGDYTIKDNVSSISRKPKKAVNVVIKKSKKRFMQGEILNGSI